MLVLVFIMVARVVMIAIAVLLRTRTFVVPRVAAGYLHLVVLAVVMAMLVVAMIAFVVAVSMMVAFHAAWVTAHLLALELSLRSDRLLEQAHRHGFGYGSSLRVGKRLNML